MTLASGTRLGPYEIVAPLGAGGMGEVYRAKDTRLGREVAVKVLPDDVAKDAHALSRFEHEAKAVAALSHPNILALYDVGEAGGVRFAVTELLEGETLRSALARGLLPRKKVLDIATQVTDALAAAHEKGIVHRDIKPENVFLTKDGRAKLLDFGIARQRPPAAPADTITPTVTALSEPGVVVGTVAYMSPEQARGKAVDFRSDQFSLGTLLYEMFAGRRPFGGGSPTETLAAILRDEPEPLENLAPAVPAPVRWIVERCLAKEAGERYDSTRDLGKELENCRAHLAEIGTGVSAPVAPAGVRPPRRLLIAAIAGVALVAILAVFVARRKSAVTPGTPTAPQGGPLRIVVLPFDNLGSPDDGYFASGMTEEITSRLANVRNLAVISRTTATQYDRKGKTVEQIGKDLGVGYVLEGSVRWDRTGGGPGRVRITPQLIRVADDTHVWADRYDRVIADVFAIQSDVAENAVKAMGVTLLPRERTALKEVSTNDVEAYDLYLRGQDLYKGGADKRHVERGLQMFQAAVDRDPRFAQALAGLARSHLWMYGMRYDRSQERLVKGKEAAERAVELRPDVAETHTALAFYFYASLHDCPRALNEFATALEIQPNSSDTLLGIGLVLRYQGRWAEAADTMSKAIDLDPKNALLLGAYGDACVLARRYPEADRAYGVAIVLSPQYPEPYGRKAWLQVQWHGDVEKAHALLEEAGRVSGLREVLVEVAVRVMLARRDFQGALRQLEVETRHSIDSQRAYLPISLFRGEVQMLAGQHDFARRSFDAARLELEDRVKQTPDNPRLHSALGLTYAGLGRRLEAVREAKLGCDLEPSGLYADDRREDLALVYTMVGQLSEAVAQLDGVLARSGWFTTHLLRLDPRWDPLRSDPRFQALLAKYEAKP